MEELRKAHNNFKRSLIESVTKTNDHILDVGSGFGGDLSKWNKCGAIINMAEPDEDALHEARDRARGMHIRVNFYLGDIHQCPNRYYDIICYNFSLHYIFQTRELFFSSIREIKNRMKRGGKLIGIIPDSESILFRTPLKDDMGNFFIMKNPGNGDFGEKLFVNLVDTPYYLEGAKSEPIAYKDLLITHLEELGFRLVKWEQLSGNPISKLYSQFIFSYKDNQT